MTMDSVAFTYRLRRDGKTVKIGKGTISEPNADKVESYFNKRKYKGFSTFDFEFHSTESAAFKAEARKIENYERQMGRLPVWNKRAGGGGGRVSARCRGYKADGTGCMNGAIEGNYGFCGVHR